MLSPMDNPEPTAPMYKLMASTIRRTEVEVTGTPSDIEVFVEPETDLNSELYPGLRVIGLLVVAEVLIAMQKCCTKITKQDLFHH